LQRLHDQLQQSKPVAITAVVGMGGIGKTELALQYARAYGPQVYPGGVCWLEARDQDITAQILAFSATYLGHSPSDELSLEARMADCWNHWPSFATEGSPTPALLVVDDVIDYEAIAPYLPITERFTLLLTTRQQRLATTVESLSIDVLDEPDALELLRELAEATRIDAEQAQAKALCHWLGYLPLGLELVGRYLKRKPDLSLVMLQTRLDEQELEARALVQTEPGMTNALNVAKAIELSWNDLSEGAQQLASLLSCFALAPIPWQRVIACLPEVDAEDIEDWRDEELLQFHLLKRVEQGRYQLHQLIQRFIRTKLVDDSPLIALYVKAMVAAAQEVDATPTQAQCLAWSEVVPHVAEATIPQWLAHVDSDDLIRPFYWPGAFLSGAGPLPAGRALVPAVCICDL
jgi:hypothetical protein